jgi:hypothetical protein
VLASASRTAAARAQSAHRGQSIVAELDRRRDLAEHVLSDHHAVHSGRRALSSGARFFRGRFRAAVRLPSHAGERSPLDREAARWPADRVEETVHGGRARRNIGGNARRGWSLRWGLA